MAAAAGGGVPAGYAGIVGTLGEERADVFVKQRVDVVVADLVHRDKDEAAKMRTRVRDGQERRVHVLLPAEKQVEVDGAWLL